MNQGFENIVTGCVKRFNRGNAALWKHSDFADLSKEILQETGTSISTNTLKRIFGKITVDEYYIPQQATIKALKQYAEHPLIKVELQKEIALPIIVPPQLKDKSKQPWLIVATIAAALLVLSMIFYNQNRQKSLTTLKFVEMEGLLPATAFFEYDNTGASDSTFLDFGDKTPVANLAKGKGRLSHNYLFPGVFTAALKSRATTLAASIVHVRSKQWIGLGYRQGHELPEHYYESVALKKGPDNLFHISNAELFSKGIDTSGLVYTRLCNFSPILYKGEDFIFEASFKNVVDKKGIYCKSTQFQVSGMKNKIRFRLSTPGCSNRISNTISEKSYQGNKVNLSKFAMELDRWTTIKMVNHHHQVTLYVNGQLLHSEMYTKSIGAIKGVFLEFEGTAYVRKCELRNDKGQVLYAF